MNDMIPGNESGGGPVGGRMKLNNLLNASVMEAGAAGNTSIMDLMGGSAHGNIGSGAGGITPKLAA
jgi:hypothetical protein